MSDASQYQAFKFAPISTGAEGNLHEVPDVGKIEITVYSAMLIGQEDPNRQVYGAAPPATTDLQVPEGKSFFKAPSAQTVAGSTLSGPAWSKLRYKKKCLNDPLIRVSVRYETETVLEMRKIKMEPKQE